MPMKPHLCVAAALLVLAHTTSTLAQDNEAEARDIFRSWQNVDAQPEKGPWEDYKADPIVDAVWQRLTPSGDQLWIDKNNLSRGGATITFWMRGDHSSNAKVKYRTSLWRLRINCIQKTVTVLATSTYAQDGTPIVEQDYPDAQGKAIRPDTVYSEIAEKLCA